MSPRAWFYGIAFSFVLWMIIATVVGAVRLAVS